MHNPPEENNIYMLLGEIRADVKGLVKSQDKMWETIDGQGRKINVLETTEIKRVARSGAFGFLGGLLINGVIELFKMKFQLK